MEWESVAHLFAKSAPKIEKTTLNAPDKETIHAMALLEANEDAVNAFLTGNGSIQEGQTWRDASEKLRQQIVARPEALVAKALKALEVAA